MKLNIDKLKKYGINIKNLKRMGTLNFSLWQNNIIFNFTYIIIVFKIIKLVMLLLQIAVNLYNIIILNKNTRGSEL